MHSVIRELFLLCVRLAPAAGTSSKMDFLPLGNVRTDPVTTPTGLSPHVHTFYGAAGSLRPELKYEELRAACGNSGNVDDNKSLYWHPTVYSYDPSTKKYTAIDIYFGSAYYVWKTGETKAFPDGFQMIARQSSGPKARVIFDCSGPSECERDDCSTPYTCSPIETQEGGNKVHDCFPQMRCSELEIKIVFPGCWDGKSLTSDDFMSHVAYTVGDWGSLPIEAQQGAAYEAECPSSHPVRIPEIQWYFRILDYEGGHHVFSDGSGLVHADYFSGWNATELQRALDQCDNYSEAASPDAWCEKFLKFRDMPKKKGDENLVEKLKLLQPSPPLDLKSTVTAEEVMTVDTLPNPSSGSTLLPANPLLSWRTCLPKCGDIGTGRGNRDSTCTTSSAVTTSASASTTTTSKLPASTDKAAATTTGALSDPANNKFAETSSANFGYDARPSAIAAILVCAALG